MNKLFIIILLCLGVFLSFGCLETAPSVAISDGATMITIVDINGFTHTIHMHDLNDVSVVGLVVGNVLSWDGNNWVPTDVNITPAGTILDTNWVTSWNVFDANMKATYALIVHDHNSLYLLKSDANLLYALKGDVNTWINQLNKAQETDSNKWNLTKLDGNALYALKGDINSWINSFQVDSNQWSLTKLDGNALYVLKGDVNVWSGQLYVPYTGANKDININGQSFYFTNENGYQDNLHNMGASIDEMRNNTLLDKSRSTLTCTGGVLNYKLIALNGKGEFDFNSKVYGESSAVPDANINLTCGTDAVPVTNYVYFELVAGVPTIKVATSNPSTEHIDVAIWTVGACSGTNYTIYSYNRNRYEVDSFISRVLDRFEYSGTLFADGFATTVTATDINIGTGEFFNGIFEMETANAVNRGGGFYFIKGDGTYVWTTKLSDLNVYSDGTTTGTNYVNIVWGIVPTTTTAAGVTPTVPKLVAVIQTKPTVVYTNLTNAIADAYESTNYYPPSTAIKQVFVPVARTIVRSGAFINWGTGLFYKDLRGKVTAGGGASPTVDLSSYVTIVDGNAWYMPFSTVLPQTKASVVNQFLKDYNAITGMFTSTQPLFSDIGGWPAACPAGTYIYQLAPGVTYCSTPLDTNWQTSWSVFDANLKATYLTKVDANGFYVLKTDLNADINAVITSYNFYSRGDINASFLSKTDANGFYVLKTDLNADINAVITSYNFYSKDDINASFLSKVDANGFYELKGAVTDTNWQTSWAVFDANMKATYNLPWSDTNWQTSWGILDANLKATYLTTYVDTNWVTSWATFDANMKGTYALKGSDTNWQTSWGILDANLKATYLTSYIDTNWVTAWATFDANMAATYRLYSVDLNTTQRLQVDKNILIGSKVYMYDDGNSLVIGRTA